MPDQKTSPSVVQCLIGSGVEISGDLKFSGGLHVEGRVLGHIIGDKAHHSKLTLCDAGYIEGDVTTFEAEINGTVKGDVHATGKVTLHPQSKVDGNIYYETIEILRGACINGKLIATESDHHKKQGLVGKLGLNKKSA